MPTAPRRTSRPARTWSCSLRGALLDMAPEEYILKGMWTIVEGRAAAKTLDKLPHQVAETYAFWCSVVRQSGPQGLRAVKGFHDEALSGKWAGHRSSRLNLQSRIIYRTEVAMVTVFVERITKDS